MTKRQPVRKPGTAQLRLLRVMERSAGIWPAAWRLNYAQTETMRGMGDAGLVENLGGRWLLTDIGRKALERSATAPTTPKVDRRRKDWTAG